MRGWVIWWAVPSDGVGNRRNGGIRPCFRRWFGLTREIPMHVELASLWKRSQVVRWRSRPLSTDSRGKKRVPSSSVRTRGNPRFFWPRDVSSRPTARRERASPLVREKEAEKPRRMAGTDVRCVPSSRRSPRSMAVNSPVNSPRSGPDQPLSPTWSHRNRKTGLPKPITRLKMISPQVSSDSNNAVQSTPSYSERQIE